MAAIESTGAVFGFKDYCLAIAVSLNRPRL
jgi:hypothetical protein